MREHKFHLLFLAVIALELLAAGYGLGLLFQYSIPAFVAVLAIATPGLLVLYVLAINILSDWGKA